MRTQTRHPIVRTERADHVHGRQVAEVEQGTVLALAPALVMERCHAHRRHRLDACVNRREHIRLRRTAGRASATDALLVDVR